MVTPLDIASIIKLIQSGLKIAETVTSNKQACTVLADDLEIVHDILASVDQSTKLKAEQFKLQRVLSKLYRITTRTNLLFDKCASGKTLIKIRTFLSATTIKGELQKLQSEVPTVLGMLSLVFHLKQTSAYSRGGAAIPAVDENVFYEEDQQDIEEAGEYYEDDDG